MYKILCLNYWQMGYTEGDIQIVWDGVHALWNIEQTQWQRGQE